MGKYQAQEIEEQRNLSDLIHCRSQPQLQIPERLQLGSPIKKLSVSLLGITERGLFFLCIVRWERGP